MRHIAVFVGALIAMMLAAPVAAGGGGGCHGPLTDEQGTTVAMSQACFSPMVVRIAEGDTVTWINNDPMEHNAYSIALPDFGTPILGSSDSASVTFNEAGVFPYVCTIHPGMVGAVVVGDADTPPPAVGVATAAADASPDDLEARLDAVEASLLADPVQTERSSWPPLAVGVLAGAVLVVLGSRLRLLS